MQYPVSFNIKQENEKVFSLQINFFASCYPISSSNHLKMASPYLAIFLLFVISYAVPSPQYGYGIDCECSDITLLDANSGERHFYVAKTIYFFFLPQAKLLATVLQGSGASFGVMSLQQGKFDDKF